MIILDTCTLIWLTTDLNHISQTAKTRIQQSAGNTFVSAISAFEISIKTAKGKLKLKYDPLTWFQLALEKHGITEIPVNSAIAANAAQLAPIHNDPMDRIIIATAQISNLTVLSPDQYMKLYPDVSVIW